jgi:cysteine desulfurase
MIYLDNNATTQPLPDVIGAVRDTLERLSGNPSSAHSLGADARRVLESSRASIADGLGAEDASQIVFTSCGTESINSAFSLLLSEKVSQVVISSVEHSAVLRASDRWAGGRKVCQVPVSKGGVLDLDALKHLVAKAPSLVSLVLANNETGVLTDMAAAAEICQRFGALLHIDAVQAVGRVRLKLAELGCAAASLSAHKFHGPPGCGILFLRASGAPNLRGCTLIPGHQENGLRGGTQNLPAIVGTARAVDSLPKSEAEFAVVARLRDRLEKRLLSLIPGSEVHGMQTPRLPNTTSLYCPERNASDLVVRLGQMGLAVSAGAACTSGGAPSHVIRAMGFSTERANSTLRFSLSRFSTENEVDEAACLVAQVCRNTLPTLQCA